MVFDQVDYAGWRQILLGQVDKIPWYMDMEGDDMVIS